LERWIDRSDVLEVIVNYKGMEIKFSGSPDEVLRSFLDFFNKVLPGYSLVSNLTLSTDLEQLLRDLEGIIAITPEGIIVTVPKEDIVEREALLLHLVKVFIGYKLGNYAKDSIAISELLNVSGGKPSSIAARLSEMVNLNWVERVGRGQYRITTYGIKSFQETVLPKFARKYGG
jgi:hypothetical protein